MYTNQCSCDTMREDIFQKQREFYINGMGAATEVNRHD